MLVKIILWVVLVLLLLGLKWLDLWEESKYGDDD